MMLRAGIGLSISILFGGVAQLAFCGDERAPQGAETLSQAWAIALAVDQSLEARRRDVLSAEQSRNLAHAQRWPLWTLDSGYIVRDNEPAFRFNDQAMPLPTTTFPNAQREEFRFLSSIGVPLYTSGRIGYGIGAAEADLLATEMDVQSWTSDVKMRVAEEYIAVLRAQRDLEVAASRARSLEGHLHEVEKLYQHAQVPRNDLLAAQVALSDARQREIQVQNQLDASRSAYNRRLRRPLTAPVWLAELTLSAVQEDLDSLTLRSIQRRAETRRLAAQAQALCARADAVRADGRPQFELRGQYAFQENRFQTPEGITSLTAGASWDVLDSGRHRYESNALRERAESVQRLKSDVESLIQLEVRRAWLDVHEAQQRMAVTREAIERAEENLRVAGMRYTHGTGTNTEVLDAVTLRAEIGRNYFNATYDAILAVLRLQRAVGDL